MMILVQITSMIAQSTAILLLIWSYLLNITLSITPQLLISSLSKSRSFFGSSLCYNTRFYHIHKWILVKLKFVQTINSILKNTSYIITYYKQG